MPDTPGWTVETSFDLLNYEYIETMDFDILFLEQQRILDYIQEGAVGVDPPRPSRSLKPFIATPIKARSAAISCSCATNMPCFSLKKNFARNIRALEVSVVAALIKQIWSIRLVRFWSSERSTPLSAT